MSDLKCKAKENGPISLKNTECYWNEKLGELDLNKMIKELKENEGKSE